MADFDVTTGMLLTVYTTSTGVHDASFPAPNGFRLTDNTPSSSTFDLTDTLIAENPGVPDGPATYIGFITNGGLDYPVIEDPVNDTTAILNIALDPATFPTLSSLTINATAFTVCFAAGTKIATPSGETAIENLAIGDPVTTADGRSVPVKWIGRQTIHTRFWGDRARLVRVSAGALGNHSDLCVTADHGMVLDGCVINASALVNGTSIEYMPLAETPVRFTVYHLETEAHDVILANGAQSETFLDMPGRRAFDNYAEYLALYSVERDLSEIAMPRITTARLLPDRVRAQLGIDPHTTKDDRRFA